MKYFFIVNCRPDKAAIRTEVERQLAEIQDQIEENGDSVELYLTTGEGDATRQVRLYSDLHPNEKVCFVACGGDGTVNEVASGLVGSQGKSLAVLHLHSNCDFIKYYPGRDFTSIREIVMGEEQQIDIIRINDSYSINVCDIGFPAAVADFANRFAMRGKKNVYRKGIVCAILFGRFNRIRMVADGENLGGWLLSCNLANCRYDGGEFLCSPYADNQDGLIDLCRVRPISFILFLFMMNAYAKGKHIKHPFFSKFLNYRQVRHVELYTKNMTSISLDGEQLPGTRFIIDLLPKAITLRLPEKIKN
ncbi:MAG: hypothetical protein MJZ49_04315 [Bacteroidales bacterium]|nr:hypothetical protein [Bacteroidales bacterium]